MELSISAFSLCSTAFFAIGESLNNPRASVVETECTDSYNFWNSVLFIVFQSTSLSSHQEVKSNALHRDVDGPKREKEGKREHLNYFPLLFCFTW